jgi:hypothetical protein
MKSDFLEFIGNARKRRSEKFRVQLSVFLVCLALSVFIWALVRLSKDYFYSVEYHLSFSNPPGNLRLLGCSDSTLTLKIKLQGFEFFSEQFLIKQDRNYEVSLRNVRLRYAGDHSSGYLLTNRIGKEIISQTSFPNDVYFVSPDTLFFEFEKERLKRMPSKPAPGYIKIQVEGRDTILRIKDTSRLKSNSLQYNKPK